MSLYTMQKFLFQLNREPEVQRRFAEDRNEKPARHWRIVNEVPTLLMIAIVILVIVKPF